MASGYMRDDRSKRVKKEEEGEGHDEGLAKKEGAEEHGKQKIKKGRFKASRHSILHGKKKKNNDKEDRSMDQREEKKSGKEMKKSGGKEGKRESIYDRQ